MTPTLPTHAGAPNRSPLRRGWVAAALFLVLGFSVLNPFLSTAIDDASYILLARSLAHRGAYLDLAYVGTPVHPHYPPAFPLLLSPVVKLWPRSILALKLVTLMAGVCFVLLSRGVADAQDEGLGWAVALLVATNPVVVALSTNVWTEIPHAALVLAYLAALRRAAASPRACPWAAAGACALLIATYLTRPIGITAFAATVLFLLLRRRLKLLLVIAVPFVLAVAAWQVRNWRAAEQSGGIYDEHFTMYVQGFLNPSASKTGAADVQTPNPLGVVARRTARHVGEYSVSIAAGVASPFYTTVLGNDTYSYFHVPRFWGGPRRPERWPRRLPAAMLALAVAVGWAVKLRRKRDVRELYFGVHAAVLLLWTWHDNKQVAGVMPFVYYYMLVALCAASRPAWRRLPRLRRPAFGLVMALLLSLSLATAGLHAALNIRGLLTVDLATDEGLREVYPDDWAARFMAARWLEAHAPPGSVVMCERGVAEALHLECGLPLTQYPVLGSGLGGQCVLGEAGASEQAQKGRNDREKPVCLTGHQ